MQLYIRQGFISSEIPTPRSTLNFSENFSSDSVACSLKFPLSFKWTVRVYLYGCHQSKSDFSIQELFPLLLLQSSQK